MAKQAKAKTKTKDSAKAKPRKPKKTVEAMTDEQRAARHFGHVKSYERDLGFKKEADKRLKGTADRITAEGGSVKMVKLAIALATDKGEKAFQTRIGQEAEVARWHGVGIQLDLFGKQKKTPAEKHFEDGKRAALNDDAAKPPDYLAQRDAQHWLSGYADGRKSLNVERAENGFKPIGEEIANLMEKASQLADAKGLGTEPPTYSEAH